MEHARLMNKFNKDSLKIINKWNSGYYNINGFYCAVLDIKTLFTIKYFCNYYDDCKNHKSKVQELLNNDNDIIDLSFKNFKQINHMFNSYNKTIDIISSKLKINLEEVILNCNKYRFPPKPELFTFDIVSNNRVYSPIIKFKDFITQE